MSTHSAARGTGTGGTRTSGPADIESLVEDAVALAHTWIAAADGTGAAASRADRRTRATAERLGAVYAITGNLYPYGPVDRPMTEDLPDAATDHKGRLRARMWADALAAHREGRVRAVEVRGSDYVGPGVGQNGHLSRVVPAALRGRTAVMMGRTDQPHTFTDVRDVARTLVAAATDPGAHGRTWHVPSNPPATQARGLADVLAAVGHPPVRTVGLRGPALAAAAAFSPLLRELRQLIYQFERPYVLDDAAARERFGITPTPWAEVCRATAAG